MLTLEYGVAQIRAALEWSERAMEVLEQMESEAGRRAGKKTRRPAKRRS
jgi:hypothetical protein